MIHPHIILLIDDDKDDRFFFKLAVQELDKNIQFCTARNGEEGLQKLCKASALPDFIFLDINMPRMDGITCLKEIKRDERLKHIPVIMYSTAAHVESIDHTEEYGSAYYMKKPIDFNALPASILHAMEMAMTNA